MLIKFTRITSSILTLGLVLVLSLGSISNATAQNGNAFIRQVRAFETDSSGPLNPVGLAYSANARAFFVVQDRAGATPGSDTDILALDTSSELTGSARIAAAVQDPINMAFDNKYRQHVLRALARRV